MACPDIIATRQLFPGGRAVACAVVWATVQNVAKKIARASSQLARPMPLAFDYDRIAASQQLIASVPQADQG
jgi:hypothetical protein